MTVKYFFISVFFITSFVGFCSANAQTTKKITRAVFVQIRSEHSRVSALTKAGRLGLVKQVEKDAKDAASIMQLDFHDNFDFCPVYYFVDTNLELLKQKGPAGLLTYENGTPVEVSVIDSIGNDFVIAYYGYALSQPKYVKNLKDTTTYKEDPYNSFMYDKPGPWIKDASKYTYDPDPPYGKGLIILNSKFEQVNNFYKLDYDIVFFTGKRQLLKKYSYKSDRFEIEYYPLAGLFNSTLLQRYRPRRILDNPSLYK